VEDGEPADGVGNGGGPAVVVVVEVQNPIADVPLAVPAGALLRGERPRLVPTPVPVSPSVTSSSSSTSSSSESMYSAMT
jgi:hypothetical protein